MSLLSQMGINCLEAQIQDGLLGFTVLQMFDGGCTLSLEICDGNTFLFVILVEIAIRQSAVNIVLSLCRATEIRSRNLVCIVWLWVPGQCEIHES